jgi:hypothetical protein
LRFLLGIKFKLKITRILAECYFRMHLNSGSISWFCVKDSSDYPFGAEAKKDKNG